MRWISYILRKELLAVLAVSLLLLVIVGLSLAAPTDFFTFNFGPTGDGGLLVTETTSFPKTSGNIRFGFKETKNLATLATGGPIALTKFALTSNSSANFSVKGLKPGNYRLTVTAGSQEAAVSTGVSSGLGSLVVSSPAGQFNSNAIVIPALAGELELAFRPLINEGWLANGFSLQAVTESPTLPPSFDLRLSADELTIQQGNTRSLTATLTPTGDFTALLDVTLRGVVKGMAASVTPAQLPILPGSVKIEVTAGINLPPFNYDLVVTATAEDANRTTEIAIFQVKVIEVSQTAPPADAVSPPPPAADTEISLPSPSAIKALRETALLLAEVQRATEKLVPQPRETQSLSFTARDLILPTLTGFPENSGPAWGLDWLRDQDTIRAVVDTAPRAPSAEEGRRPTLFERFIRFFVRSVR